MTTGRNLVTMKKHFIIRTLTIAVTLGFLLANCTTPSDNRPEGRIVERSKQLRPVWADSPLNQLAINATEVKFHYAKFKQRDLPIAVKTSQTEAIESSFTPWRPSFDSRIKEFPKLIAAGTGPSQKEYEILLDQAAHRVHAQAAQIEDIYYERVRIEDASKVPELTGVSEYFDVHVLVQLQQVDSERLNNALFQTFSTAKSLTLRKVAKDFAPLPEAKKPKVKK
jgi:hypothetical protein